jgi:hypothetical protein
MNPISSASAALVAGFSRFDAASTAAVSAFNPGSTASPASAVVDQIAAKQQVQAASAVVRASDWTLKQLLDIKV